MGVSTDLVYAVSVEWGFIDEMHIGEDAISVMDFEENALGGLMSKKMLQM